MNEYIIIRVATRLTHACTPIVQYSHSRFWIQYMLFLHMPCKILFFRVHMMTRAFIHP